MSFRRRALSICLSLVLLVVRLDTDIAHAQEPDWADPVVTVHVTNEVDGSPVAGAQVRIMTLPDMDTGESRSIAAVLSDANGEATISLKGERALAMDTLHKSSTWDVLYPIQYEVMVLNAVDGGSSTSLDLEDFTYTYVDRDALQAKYPTWTEADVIVSALETEEGRTRDFTLSVETDQQNTPSPMPDLDLHIARPLATAGAGGSPTCGRTHNKTTATCL